MLVNTFYKCSFLFKRSTIVRMTKTEAESWCQDFMNQSPGYVACKDVSNVDQSRAVEICVLDILVINFFLKVSSNKKLRYKQIEIYHQCFQYTPLNLSDFIECTVYFYNLWKYFHIYIYIISSLVFFEGKLGRCFVVKV